jgi:mRNA-degrading endonuclease RelE of RelBE toxin-antitoxin system
MAYKLQITNKAKQDIIDGFYWYETKSNGLGGRFVEEVEKSLNYIHRYPLHFQIKYKNIFREAVLKIFPYVVIYEIIEKTVVVYSVFPTPMNPEKKP